MKTRWNLMMVIVLLAALLVVLVPAQPVQADDVAIKFIQVSAGQWHTCALSEDGIISCWGADDGTGLERRFARLTEAFEFLVADVAGGCGADIETKGR